MLKSHSNEKETGWKKRRGELNKEIRKERGKERGKERRRRWRVLYLFSGIMILLRMR